MSENKKVENYMVLNRADHLAGCYNNSTRIGVNGLTIPCCTLSPDGKDAFHCVEATCKRRIASFRVITNLGYGINIRVNLNSHDKYMEYRKIRFLVRNTDKVLLTFSDLFITASVYKQELCVDASSFTLCK